ncbi:MAG: GNAT family N-acetyltransferase [Oscillatoriales cyanobacterium]|nr:MAG: GNAT family N-acetyltransferase [Oscillatoriales cyanobacterium]
MNVAIRRSQISDIDVCARINYEAFKDISDRHCFPHTDFLTVELAAEITRFWIESPSYFGVVAENDGAVVGCGMASLSLYASLGFEVKEPFVLMEGKFRSVPQYGFEVRPMAGENVGECAALCEKVCGCDRTSEIEYALNNYCPLVAYQQGRIVAYTCAISALGHSVAETEADMQVLLLGAAAYSSEDVLAFHLPLRYGSLFRWCLQQGLRAVKPMAVMAVGEYQSPEGCWFPSFVY